MCESVTGAIVVLSLQYGSYRNDDDVARYYTYQRAYELIQRIKEIHRSFRRGDVLGYDLSSPQKIQTVIEKGLFMQLCPNLVKDAAQILVKMKGSSIPLKSE